MSLPVFSGVHVARSLFFLVFLFCRPLFSLLSFFFFWPLYCLSSFSFGHCIVCPSLYHFHIFTLFLNIRFVEIDGIVTHYCFSFLFIIKNLKK